MTIEPSITTRPAQPYLGLTKTITMTTFHLVADRIGEIIGVLGEQGQAPAGGPFFRYHVIDMANELVVEVGVPTAEPPRAEGGFVPAELPAGRYVTVLHHGHPDQLHNTIAGLLAWARGQGLEFDMHTSPKGEHWASRVETYLTDPRVEPDMANWTTELAFKLAD
ncbi:effector-binding domain-containing protein [Crossiella equi]|uniref:Effector-binding domain-containing protein n=1 Tax=Crossiella equi TaxID=130796 RepID=A0ABS5A474_9PSEU|nr:GyrI-like domain-containing protein [Crossiella equi]MBP2471328.1 effector-binding domain-containing protein [Crossiella equi]